MSKHLGNVVDPDDLVERFGADTVRLALVFAAKPQRSLNWSDSAVLRCHRFLGQVWDYVQAHVALKERRRRCRVGERDRSTEHMRDRLEKWTTNGLSRITDDMQELEMHSAARNVMRLFDRIRDYEKRVLDRDGVLTQTNLEALLAALTVLVQRLRRSRPHIADELYELLTGADNLLSHLGRPYPSP